LLRTHCGACHSPGEDGALSRISEQRKTAEGWEMTINRMRMIHGMTLSGQEISIAADVMRDLVKYLADTQGLAPEESAPYRYLIEQDLNRVEDFDPGLAVMCGRCHSSARFALQRRTEGEWERLVHFHLGQYPSTEYSLYGRDRDWYSQAFNEVVPQLAELYPLDTEAWRRWQAADRADFSGRWIVSGHMAGRGQMSATMQVEGRGGDRYRVTLEGRFSNGDAVTGTGNAVVYTGYDWRAQLNLGDETFRQVLAADSSGERFEGRMFLRDQELQGMKVAAVRAERSAILGVHPRHVRRGQTRTLSIVGAGLDGNIRLPAGLSLDEILSRDDRQIELRVTADVGAPLGYGNLQVGDASLPGSLVVYDSLDALQVEPAYGIARVGANGGSTPRVNAEFRAVGIDYGPDREPGTGDDLELGYMDGVRWAVSPWDGIAERDRDVKFAGRMQDATGIFLPADAGPNPERRMGTNNAGNLKVTATVQGDGQQATGDGHLIVTVQRWNSPPLK
jgi:quinohemoprotein amine dehydrogenase